MAEQTHYSSDGKDAYAILKEHPECPVKLPVARSMTQASIDFFATQDRIIEWYENTAKKN